MHDFLTWWQGEWSNERLKRFVYLREALASETWIKGGEVAAPVTVWIEPDLLSAIRIEAESAGLTITEWMTKAAQAQLSAR